MVQQLKNYYHLLRAIIAKLWFGNPGRALTIIGVTGTDGKTTTANLIYHILQNAGKKAAVISTVSALINGKEYDTGFHVSTPDSFVLQSYLQKAKRAGCTHVVLEVTSHGLDQNRVYGINFVVGVITNISREHLDYHKTIERYLRAKVKLLDVSQVAVLNKDDQSYKMIVDSHPLPQDKKIVTYGLSKNADVNPENTQFFSSLPGEFNRYNCFAAIAVARVLGLDERIIKKSITSFVPPRGRMEVVYDKDYKVIIDFAHTPNALYKLLESLRADTKGRLIHVFGSAGQRDSGKRSLMGKASSSYADIIILTAEDPRGEDVKLINSEIKKGMTNLVHTHEIENRQHAINYAIQQARRHDTVVITGKGHEKSMNIQGKELPWSEHEAVKIALDKKINNE